jgi:fluoroquinolone resistance protein
MADASALLERDSVQDQRFDGGDLTGADLGGRELSACVLRGVRLAETRWREARLDDCRFEDCDLSRMSPDALGARGVVFAGCKMMGIDWSNVGPYPALSFERCDLRYDSFVSLKLRKVAFTGCNLEEAQLVDCDLTEASFLDCRLDGARFERCDLRKASFAGSTGLALPPEGNQLRGAKIPVESAIRFAESFGLRVLK